MKAIIIKEFNRRGELQKIGSVIEITQEAFSSLAGFVTAATEDDLMQMIRDAYAELDALRDWTGWRKSLTANRRCQLQALEERIDTSYADEDKGALKSALRDYREFHLTTLPGQTDRVQNKEQRR